MLCLPAQIRNHFISSLKDGSLDLEKLAAMPSSEARRAELAKYVGDKAAEATNVLFEKNLLVKNQNNGFISFIKDAIKNESVKKDLIAKVERLGEVLTPEDKAKYYEDLVSYKLGTRTSFEDAKVISELSKEFQKARSLPMDAHAKGNFTPGAAEIALNRYMNNLKLANEATTLKETLGNFRAAPLKTIMNSVSDLAGVAKGLKASLDNSAIFRQGWKTLFTNPTIWAKNAVKSFSDITKQLGRKASDETLLDGIQAEILSRPYARSGMYKKMGLDIGNLEEAYPSSFVEKIPALGRLYKASETAYRGFLYRMRADIADQMIAKAVDSGVDMSVPLQAESIGKLINSLTGRGKFSNRIEGATKELNTVFFSPKMLKSSFDFLTLHSADTMSQFARKQAAINLAKATAGIATILYTAEALHPGSVETDPRSADFGKIRIGDTRYDVSGGMSSMVTLAMRILKQSTKSSTTGKVTKLNLSDFGSRTGMDVLTDFAENKLSPMAALMKNLVNQKDFDGKPITFKGEAVSLLVPLPIENLYEKLQDPNADQILASTIADGLGISANTYSNK